MKKNLSFVESFQRLEDINAQLQSSAILDVEAIVAMQKEAQELYAFCDALLRKVESDLLPVSDL